MGLLGKLNFWKKPKVSAVQPVILEEGARQELRPHCVQQDTIREVEEEGGVVEAPSSSRSAEVNREAVRQSQAQPKISFDDTDTRTPSPSECGDPDSLNFDAKPEHTYLGITKEFGHMIGSSLQSNKWDRRCQALKSMLQVLKGLDLEGMAPPGSTGVLGSLRPRDPVKRWRLTCQLLHHVIRDKVMPVRLAALDLYQQAFSDLECFEKAEVVYASGVLVEHLIDRLGDSNVRLHEAARRCLIFTAEKPRLGPKSVLDRLREKLNACPKGGERAKVHFGVLDTVSALLEHFNQDTREAQRLESTASQLRGKAERLQRGIHGAVATAAKTVADEILKKTVREVNLMSEEVKLAEENAAQSQELANEAMQKAKAAERALSSEVHRIRQANE